MVNYQELKQTIDNLPFNDNILIGGHQNTDYDSIGSTLALTRFLNKLGKKTYALIEEKDLPKLEWYGNYDYIISEYNSDENYNFILLDANRKSRLGIFEEYFDNASIKINIDHHEDNKKQCDYIFVDENISSTCEIIYNLLILFENALDESIASLLYAGIVSDSNCFYKSTTSDTLKVASDLLKFNIDGNYIIKKTCKSLSMDESKVLSDMMSNIKYDDFHYIIMDRNNDIYRNIDYNVIFKKCASTIYEISEIKIIGLFLKELDGSISGIYRSNCEINVDKLATQLGGGGHKKASGFENNMSLDEILKITKEYIKAQTEF